MTIQRTDHVSVVVDDLEAAEAFSLELGLELADAAPIRCARTCRRPPSPVVRLSVAAQAEPKHHTTSDLQGQASTAAEKPLPGATRRSRRPPRAIP